MSEVYFSGYIRTTIRLGTRTGECAETVAIVDLRADGTVTLADRVDRIKPTNAKRSDVKNIVKAVQEHFDVLATRERDADTTCRRANRRGAVGIALGSARRGSLGPELIEGIFGNRQWMSLIGKKGGSARSEAKVRAVRESGRKGGRPKKSVAQACCLQSPNAQER